MIKTWFLLSRKSYNEGCMYCNNTLNPFVSLKNVFSMLMVFIARCTPTFLRHSLHWWVVQLFLVFHYANSAAMNIHKMTPYANVQALVQDRALEMDFVCHKWCTLLVLIHSLNAPKCASLLTHTVSKIAWFPHILTNTSHCQSLKILQIWLEENGISFGGFPV